MVIIEFYVNDIIFGSDDDRLSQKFTAKMKNEFEIPMLIELPSFWDYKSPNSVNIFLFIKLNI